jgi:uncharacterized membrane protein
MIHVDIFFRLAFIAIAFCVVAGLSTKAAQRATEEVLRLEQPDVVGEVHWDVLNLRATVAGIWVMLMFTNGLIAALLAAEIFR